MSLDLHKPLTTKKMKKRKELDALVSSEKLASKFGSAASNGVVAAGVSLRSGSGGSGSGGVGRKSSRQSHQLLDESGTNSDNELQQELSGEGEVYAQLGERRYRRRHHTSGCSACGQNCISFLSICSFLITIASIVAVTAIAWMQMETKRELSLLRQQCRRADKSESDVLGDLIESKNRVDALAAKEDAAAKRLLDIETAATNDRKSLDELRASMKALKASVTTASGLDNLPRDLEALQKEVATVGSNVESLRAEAKQTSAKVKQLAIKNEEIQKELAAKATESQVAKDANASMALIKNELAKLKSEFFGDDKVSGVKHQLEAMGKRIDGLSKSITELPKPSAEITTESAVSSTSIARTTQPTPVKQKNIMSAQPHEVTGVVGETTTSSSPASEMASTSVAHHVQQEISKIGQLLANKDKHES